MGSSAGARAETRNMASERIGLIGLGLLGTALASRLLGAGHEVLGFDVSADRREALLSLGGQCGADAGEVAGGCRRLLFSLPNSDIVRRVWRRSSRSCGPAWSSSTQRPEIRRLLKP